MSGMLDPKDWRMVLGDILLGGFTMGSHIEVTHRTPAATTTIGADGQGTIVVSHDKSGTIKITLRREHPVNRRLSEMLALTRAGSRLAVRPLLVENTRYKSFAKATDAYVASTPSLIAATEFTPIEWMIEAVSLDIFHGDGAEFSGVG